MRFIKYTLFLMILIILFSSCGRPKKLHDVWDVVNIKKEDIKLVEDTQSKVTEEEKEFICYSILDRVNRLKLDSELVKAPDKFNNTNIVNITTKNNQIYTFSYDQDNLKITDDKENVSWYSLKHEAMKEQVDLSEFREWNKWRNKDATILNKLKFTAGDIKKISFTGADLYQDNNIIYDMGRLQKIELLKRLYKAPDVGNVYDEYNMELSDGKAYRFLVYDGFLKVINKDGKTIWYKIKIHMDYMTW